jgi:hypothetical protein
LLQGYFVNPPAKPTTTPTTTVTAAELATPSERIAALNLLATKWKRSPPLGGA